MKKRSEACAPLLRIEITYYAKTEKKIIKQLATRSPPKRDSIQATLYAYLLAIAVLHKSITTVHKLVILVEQVHKCTAILILAVLLSNHSHAKMGSMRFLRNL